MVRLPPTVDELHERATDWERYAADPDTPEEDRAMYAELARRDRAEIARRESVSW